MSVAHYCDRLLAAIRSRGTAAVVGLDPTLANLPGEFAPKGAGCGAAADALEHFSRAVIDVVAPLVPAVKINVGFFEAYREAGYAAYFRLIGAAQQAGLLVIGDIKRGDIGSTAQLYAQGHLAPAAGRESQAVPDAVTLAGYLGQGAVAPFVDAAARDGRGVYVLVRPSDPGADAVHEFGAPLRFYEHMARLVSDWGAPSALRGACGLSCVGAVVAPKDLLSTQALRAALPHTPLLVPGYGAQGGSLDACRACFLPDGSGAVVNASRSVVQAFQAPAWRARYGDDWRACVRAAASEFAATFSVAC